MLLVLIACTGPVDVSGTGDDSESTSDCRSGLEEADASTVVLESLTVDGSGYRPTANLLCTSPDGLAMRVELPIEELDAIASVYVSVPSVGGYYLLDGLAEVELGLGTTTWGQDEIVAGQTQFLIDAGTAYGTFNATAMSDAGTLLVDLAWNAPAQ